MHFTRKYLISALVICVFLSVSSSALAIVRDITFPVNGASSFRDDFHEPRGADGTREHLGIDIISSKMTPVVSAVDGVLSYIVSPQASWGYSISIRDNEGFQYRYLHLNNDTPGTDDGLGGEANAYVAGLRRGINVTKGQHIGWVGDSGNAETTVSHLHFEIRDLNRTVINPYETLVASAGKSSNSSVIKTGTTITVVHTSEGDQGLNDDFINILTKELFEGERSEAVRQLQSKLSALGYYKYTITDFFDSLTRESVRNFQIASKLTPTGFVDQLTWAKLQTSIAVAPVASPNSGSYVFTKNLAAGSSGEAVKQLQIKLKTLDYFSGTATGFFGPITKASVILFQRSINIDPIGIVGPKTRAALNL